MTAEYAKTFYLGTKLMTPEKARAVWAIYVWCRRTDELVDGPNASHITPEVRLRAGIHGRLLQFWFMRLCPRWSGRRTLATPAVWCKCMLRSALVSCFSF